jgi:glycerate-2-kinase
MDATLEAANPKTIIRKHVKLVGNELIVDDLTYSLRFYRRIIVIGAGKASGGMGEEIEKLLGPKIAQGIVIVPDYLNPWPKGRRINYFGTSHPIPTEKTVRRTTQLVRLAETAGKEDLTIMLLSGGASSLMESPVSGLTLQDQRKTADLLLKSGARIQEINTVRKHLSRVKGGRLAEILSDTHLLTLIISDVIGDELDAIGSGPTAPDLTTYKDSRQVLQKYSIWSKVPGRVRKIIERGIEGGLPETPKSGDRAFRNVQNVIIGTNRQSCEEAVRRLKRSGYAASILSTHIVGEAREAGSILGSILTEICNNGLPRSRAVAIVCGGETTVTIIGNGRGGRNQELALAAALAIDGTENAAAGSLATDGVDGPTDAAGAIVDGTTVSRGHELGMSATDYLRNNDSYNFLKRTGNLVKTGPTGTNVNDVMIIAAVGPSVNIS